MKEVLHEGFRGRYEAEGEYFVGEGGYNLHVAEHKDLQTGCGTRKVVGDPP